VGWGYDRHQNTKPRRYTEAFFVPLCLCVFMAEELSQSRRPPCLTTSSIRLRGTRALLLLSSGVNNS
jgi:hypothetical protein